MDYLKSEHLKFKRTISNKLIFIVPLITAIFAWLIRSKLNKLEIQPIATVWGIGYKWE